MKNVKTPAGTIKATDTEFVLAEMVFKACMACKDEKSEDFIGAAQIMADWREGFLTSDEAMGYIIRLAKGRAKARRD